MKSKILKNIEWSILICVGILITIGCIALYAATVNTGNEDLIKQLVWLLISIPIMICIIFIDYELIVKVAPIAYAITLILLLAEIGRASCRERV